MQSVRPNNITQRQIALLERALLILSRVDENGWHDIPPDVRISLGKSVEPDTRTYRPDLLTLRTSDLMIVPDTIARAGEFSSESANQPSHDAAPLMASAASRF